MLSWTNKWFLAAFAFFCNPTKSIDLGQVTPLPHGTATLRNPKYLPGMAFFGQGAAIHQERPQNQVPGEKYA